MTQVVPAPTKTNTPGICSSWSYLWTKWGQGATSDSSIALDLVDIRVAWKRICTLNLRRALKVCCTVVDIVDDTALGHRTTTPRHAAQHRHSTSQVRDACHPQTLRVQRKGRP